MNAPKPTIVTAVDLELEQPSEKIIQIGYCVGNYETREILDSGRLYIKTDEPISEYISKLTGITQKQIDDWGMSLEQAYKYLALAHCGHNSCVNAVTWGGGDTSLLKSQLNINEADWVFGRRWIDCKTLFQEWRRSQKLPVQGGLAKSMLKLGLKFEGRKHDAKDDAINTFRMYCVLIRKFRK